MSEPLLLDALEEEEDDTSRTHTNILVAVDGSSASDHAVHRAFNRFYHDGDRIDLCYVFERKRLADQLPTEQERTKEAIFESAAKLTKKYDDYFKEKKAKGTFHFVQAWDAPEGIMAVIKKKNIDLLVIGTRGYGTVKSFFLGSVSKYLVNHAACSVIVVK